MPDESIPSDSSRPENQVDSTYSQQINFPSTGVNTSLPYESQQYLPDFTTSYNMNYSQMNFQSNGHYSATGYPLPPHNHIPVVPQQVIIPDTLATLRNPSATKVQYTHLYQDPINFSSTQYSQPHIAPQLTPLGQHTNVGHGTQIPESSQSMHGYNYAVNQTQQSQPQSVSGPGLYVTPERNRNQPVLAKDKGVVSRVKKPSITSSLNQHQQRINYMDPKGIPTCQFTATQSFMDYNPATGESYNDDMRYKAPGVPPVNASNMVNVDSKNSKVSVTTTATGDEVLNNNKSYDHLQSFRLTAHAAGENRSGSFIGALANDFALSLGSHSSEYNSAFQMKTNNPSKPQFDTVGTTGFYADQNQNSHRYFNPHYRSSLSQLSKKKFQETELNQLQNLFRPKNLDSTHFHADQASSGAPNFHAINDPINNHKLISLSRNESNAVITNIPINKADFNLDIRTSKLGTNFYLKFADIYYPNILRTLSPDLEHSMHAIMFVNDSKPVLDAKIKLLKFWSLTEPSIRVHYCSCQRNIWLSEDGSKCPFHTAETHSAPSNIHHQIPFTIALVNNFIISILLNKKLRIYLKKNLRNSKKAALKSDFVNNVQDGILYRDVVNVDDSTIDFVFTFTVITLESEIEDQYGGKMSSVFLVMNELPIELRYATEFMFLVAVYESTMNNQMRDAILEPLNVFINRLNDTILRININRHEYFAKVMVIMKAGTQMISKLKITDLQDKSKEQNCEFCYAPYTTMQNESGVQFRTVSNTVEYAKRKASEPAIGNLQSNAENSVKGPRIDPIRCTILDCMKCTLDGVFKDGIITILKTHFLLNENEEKLCNARANLVLLDEDAASKMKLHPESKLVNTLKPDSCIPFCNIPFTDLKYIQNILSYVLKSNFSELFDGRSSEDIPPKLKVFNLLLELNNYITLFYTTEKNRVSIPLISASFIYLVKEIEHLSKFNEYKELNLLRLMPLHCMNHFFERWEDIGELAGISCYQMEEGTKKFNYAFQTNPVSGAQLEERIQLYNIDNCMKIYNYAVKEYPTFKFLHSIPIRKEELQPKAAVKVKEFDRKFLIEVVDESLLQKNTRVEDVVKFELNSIEITPSPKSNCCNLVRIKGLKRTYGWKYVFIHGMKKITYVDEYTKETVTGVFIEYKEIKTDRAFHKASENRLAFSTGDYVSPALTKRELRCVWLEDVHMVALQIIGPDQFIYDPLPILSSVFNVIQ
jgi:hypothetical protein